MDLKLKPLLDLNWEPSPKLPANGRRNEHGRSWGAVGLFLVICSIYVLSGPGRIDMIDGQLRYETTRSLIEWGKPSMHEKFMKRVGVTGLNGRKYSWYGSAASVVAIPLVWFGEKTIDPLNDTKRFLFSLTSSIFGALAAVVLFLFYLDLGVSRKRAVGWTLVSAFATLVWPLSTSSFDNAQHSLFALLAVYLGYRSYVRRSPLLAFLGGLAAGALFNYQEYFVLITPFLALSVVEWLPDPPEAGDRERAQRIPFLPSIILKARAWYKSSIGRVREVLAKDERAAQSRQRYLLFVLASGIGLALSMDYNWLRFDSFFETGQSLQILKGHPPTFGSPISGFFGLLLSPGKSIFLYSPPIILALLGLKRLQRLYPQLGVAIGLSGVVLLLFLSNVLFFGGDWCWGPRYLVVLLPLFALSLPFLPISKLSKLAYIVIISLGFTVQVLALSVDHQRFFMERALPDHFWAYDPLVYFKHSALFARPAEFVSLFDGEPPEANTFSPSLDSRLLTYCILGAGPARRFEAPGWMRQFQVFYLPRPWPLWMTHIEPARRPINLERWLVSLLLAFLTGSFCIWQTLRQRKHQN